jgi:hypothetical protein
MKNLIFVLILFLLVGCKQNDENKQNGTHKDEFKVPPVKTGAFYKTDLNKNNAVVIADTIIYSVTTKNASPEDEWTEYCLRKMDNQALANIVFNAIYNGRLTPYNYDTEEPMTIAQVRAFEKDNRRDKIAKVQFVEEWYFDEQNLQMGKRVNAIMLAYELRNRKNEVSGYKAGIKVYLTDKKKRKAKR